MAPIPIHVLTGFLGSGKTTLLNAALREPALAGTAVLMNELGEVAIDHDLVAEVAPDRIVTTTGCICCAASADVAGALQQLTERHAAGLMPPFARVILETTGLADPVPVVHALLAGAGQPGPEAAGFRLAGVTTLFDVIHGEQTLDDHFEALKQLALADLIVLTKTDLAADPASRREIEAARDRLGTLNPGTRIVERKAGWPEIVAHLASAGAYDTCELNADAAAWLAAEAVAARAHPPPEALDTALAGSDPAASGPPRHDGTIAAHVVAVDRPLDARAFHLFLEMLRLSAGTKILRLKGLVALTDEPDRPLVVHGVQQMISPVARLDRWPSADRRTRLVLIGRDLKPAVVQRMLDSLTSRALGGAR